jgi:hypothetical protein
VSVPLWTFMCAERGIHRGKSGADWVHRYSESENFGFQGGYNVWIRNRRNHHNYLRDCLARAESVGLVVPDDAEERFVDLESAVILNSFVPYARLCHLNRKSPSCVRSKAPWKRKVPPIEPPTKRKRTMK